MIRHKCHSCGTPMESPDNLADQMRNCPACKFPNRVPGEQLPQPSRATDESLLKAIGLAASFFLFWIFFRVILKVFLGTAMDTQYIVIQVILGCFGSMLICIGGYFYYSKKTHDGAGE